MPRETLNAYHPERKRKEVEPYSETAWIFPGQGSQFVGMGQDLFTNSRLARRRYRKADKALDLPSSISGVSFRGPEATLNQTLYAQPAIFIFNYICERLLEKQGIVSSNKKMVAGHSLGEYNALVAAGALSFKEALWLVGERGKAMSKACVVNPGGMVALPLRETDEKLVEMMELFGLEKSVINGHEQTVLAGSHKSLEEAAKWRQEKGIKGTNLIVEGAFHSSLMKPAVEDFSKALAQVKIKRARIPIVGNTTATFIQSPEKIRHELLNQLTRPVLWKDSLVLMTRNGIGQTIEIGDKGILSKMNLKVNGGKIETIKSLIENALIYFVLWKQPQAAPQFA